MVKRRSALYSLFGLLLVGGLPSCASPAPEAASPGSKSPATSPAADPATPPSAAPAPAPASTPDAAALSAHHAVHWSYSGEGAPGHWGDLEEKFAVCKTGKQQSPIELPIAATPTKGLAPLKFESKLLPLQIFNNGHTVQVAGVGAQSVAAEGEKYDLVQFHFHTPSEHTLGGKHTDMEVHLVHKNAKGELLVVGILLRKGKENAALAPIWKALPAEVSEEPRSIAGVSVDLSKLLPQQRSYYSYSGSLTTPPCTESVKWRVLSTVGEISAEQILAYSAIMKGDTARPTQPLEGRQIGFVP